MFIILLVYKFLSLLNASCLASPRPKKGEGTGGEGVSLFV